MTTAEKTTAINQIVANYQDNTMACSTAQIPPGVNNEVMQARLQALIEDLKKVFVMAASGGEGPAPAARRAVRKPRG